MALDTIDVVMSGADALRVMTKLDHRGEEWQLVQANNPTSATPNPYQHRELDLWASGDEANLRVVLKADGTWHAVTAFCVGEVTE